MEKFFIDNGAKDLIVFFAGWGCDNYQFANLKDSNYDVLILFDYVDLSLSFDFAKYQNIEVLAYSAGGMIAAIITPQIANIKTKIAINSNPYLFDKKLGVPPNILEVFGSINADNYMDFRQEYMVLGKDELALYNQFSSQRTIENCEEEYLSLIDIYKENYQHLDIVFDGAIFGDSDKIFDLKTQKDFYKNKMIILPNARHHIFFRFASFEEILAYAKREIK